MPSLDEAERAFTNLGSKGQTAASVMLDTHWSMMRLESRWTWERFVRLAKFLEMTPYELASLVMLRHQDVPSYLERGMMHPKHRTTRLIALFLQLVENHVMGAWDPAVVLDPFPHLKNLPRGKPPRPKVIRGAVGRPRKHPRSPNGTAHSVTSPNHAPPEGS